MIKKIEEFNGRKKWLKDWEIRERRKTENERKSEKELFDAIYDNEWERTKSLIQNGTKFDYMESDGGMVLKRNR